MQIAVSFEVVTEGSASTVMFTVSVFEQELMSVATSVYVVGEVGVATGLEIFALLNVPAGLQMKVCPPLPVSVVPLPKQTEASAPALTMGSGLAVIVAVSEFVQPFASVPIRVYVEDIVGTTEILVVVAPVLHK